MVILVKKRRKDFIAINYFLFFFHLEILPLRGRLHVSTIFIHVSSIKGLQFFFNDGSHHFYGRSVCFIFSYISPHDFSVLIYQKLAWYCLFNVHRSSSARSKPVHIVNFCNFCSSIRDYINSKIVFFFKFP